MIKKIHKSIKKHDDVAPPFVVDHSRTANLTKDSAQSLRAERSNLDRHADKPARDDKIKKPSRLTDFCARVFQDIAYICIAVGIMAVLAVIVAAAINLLPTNNPATTVSPGSSGGSGDAWIWLMIGGLAPSFFVAFQVIIGVVGILILIYIWKKSVYVARKLIWRVADEFLKPLKVVEPIALLVAYAVGIIGAWWLAGAELFVALTVICLAFLVAGLLSLLIMRKLSGEKFDFTRADLH
ncbi:hypothetical protein FWF74_01030 [Candidatus Saccharibacteria bacterium]|nr:hypothetical protein [Candidatus Saccharibacteria bacterium]MCL1963230.1 hypothetical protein [Candidatus Saccharibacteria bacterium]